VKERKGATERERVREREGGERVFLQICVSQKKEKEKESGREGGERF